MEINNRFLFKAKRIDNGEWVQGFYYVFMGKHYIFEQPFENDILKCGSCTIVHWNEKYASWTLTRKGWMYNHFFGEAQDPEECVIIGNIFDNPELKHKYDKNEEK